MNTANYGETLFSLFKSSNSKLPSLFILGEKIKDKRKKTMSSSDSSNNMTTSSSSRNMKWSEIPTELLEIIGKHLDSRIDVFRFRAVSTLWRSIVPLSHLQSHPIPLNLPPPIKAATTSSTFTICRLEHQTRSSACLVKVVESTTSGKLQLLHPLNSPNVSASHFQGSNNQNNSSNIMRSINMLDFRLVELTKGFSLEFKRRLNDFRIKKVVSFGNQGIIVLFDSGKLWYWKFGDKVWFHLGTETTHYDDIMVYKNKFYVIDNLGIISWIDDRSMNLVQYAPPLCGFGHVKQLVESEGEFYVVDSYLEEDVVGGVQLEFNLIQNHNHNQNQNQNQHHNHLRSRRVDIKVYKLDEEWGTWVDVKSLGDRVFVLGKEVSCSVSAEEFPGCPGDCIYFVDPRMEDRNVRGELKRLVVRVFRFDNGTIRTMDCFPAYKRLFSPSALWFLAPLSPP